MNFLLILACKLKLGVFFFEPDNQQICNEGQIGHVSIVAFYYVVQLDQIVRRRCRRLIPSMTAHQSSNRPVEKAALQSGCRKRSQ